MFARYTHFGIGHPAMLRKIVQDTLGSHSVTRADTMDIANSREGEDDVEGLEEYEDVQEDDDIGGIEEFSDEFSDEELDEEDSEECRNDSEDDDFDNDFCF